VIYIKYENYLMKLPLSLAYLRTNSLQARLGCDYLYTDINIVSIFFLRRNFFSLRVTVGNATKVKLLLLGLWAW